MRHSLFLRTSLWIAPVALAAATLVGCSEKPAETSGEDGPGIDASAAASVAFTYSYNYLVPANAVASVQEQHAAACEKLGPQRCRITGMHYGNADRDAWGTLDLLLDRDVARSFGRDAGGTVTRSGGKLTDATIEGTDMAPALAAASTSAQAGAQQAEAIRQRLAQPGLGDRERTELTQQAAALASQAATVRAQDRETRATLAQTPMHLRYQGASGYALSSNPFAEAVDAFISSGRSLVWVVLIAAGYLLPWAVLLIAIVAFWHGAPGRWLRRLLNGRSTSGE